MFSIIENFILFGLGISMDFLSFISVMLNIKDVNHNYIKSIINDFSQKRKENIIKDDDNVDDEETNDDDEDADDVDDEDADDVDDEEADDTDDEDADDVCDSKNKYKSLFDNVDETPLLTARESFFSPNQTEKENSNYFFFPYM